MRHGRSSVSALSPGCAHAGLWLGVGSDVLFSSAGGVVTISGSSESITIGNDLAPPWGPGLWSPAPLTSFFPACALQDAGLRLEDILNSVYSTRRELMFLVANPCCNLI